MFHANRKFSHFTIDIFRGSGKKYTKSLNEQLAVAQRQKTLFNWLKRLGIACISTIVFLLSLEYNQVLTTFIDESTKTRMFVVGVSFVITLLCTIMIQFFDEMMHLNYFLDDIFDKKPSGKRGILDLFTSIENDFKSSFS